MVAHTPPQPPSLPTNLPDVPLRAGYRWEPSTHKQGALWLLREKGSLVVASVSQRLDGQWVARIDRHRLRDRSAVAPTRKVAAAWVARWVHARSKQLDDARQEPHPGLQPPLRTWQITDTATN